MNNESNPFLPGDRVVCIYDNWSNPTLGPNPKKGDVLVVKSTWLIYLDFGKYDYIFEHSAFAPVQDATEMESEETEFAHYQEMTA